MKHPTREWTPEELLAVATILSQFPALSFSARLENWIDAHCRGTMPSEEDTPKCPKHRKPSQ